MENPYLQLQQMEENRRLEPVAELHFADGTDLDLQMWGLQMGMFSYVLEEW